MKTEKILRILKRSPHFDKLRFVYLYGSAASGSKTERSDTDICLYYDLQNKEKLHHLLFKISGSFPDNYDIQLFNLLPLYVQKEVFKGKLIYAKNMGFVHDLARKTFQDYKDFELRYKYILYGKIGLKEKVKL